MPDKQLIKLLNKLRPIGPCGLKRFLEDLYNRDKSLRKVCDKLREINIKLRTKDLIMIFEFLGIKRIACNTQLVAARDLNKKRKPFRGSKREKLYIWGFCKGDARIEASLTSIRIDVNGKLPTVLCIYEVLKDYISERKENVIKKLGTYYAFSQSIHKKSFSFLLLEMDEIANEIVDLEDLIALLAGLLDSEGCIYCTVRKRRYSYNGKHGISYSLDHHIEITNCDAYLLITIRDLLKKFGIKGTIPKSKTGFGCSRLRIYQRSHLLKIIPLLLKYVKHAEKKQKLEKLYRMLKLLQQMNASEKRKFLEKYYVTQ